MPLSPEWAKLPKRRCDDCGKLYKPVRPRRIINGEQEMGFCSDNCRKSYHKHGGAYRKLRGEMRKMVERKMQEIRQELQTEIEQIRGLLNVIAKHTDAPYRVELVNERPIARPNTDLKARTVPGPNPRSQA